MTNPNPERGGPREPYNVPVRFYGGRDLNADVAELRWLMRNLRLLIADGIRRGVLPPPPASKKSNKPRPTKKRR